MGLGRTWAMALVGMKGVPVEVQAHAGSGLPDARILGSVSTALKESRHRVKVAIQSCGLTWPDAKVVINLAPADVPKQGSAFDLAIATSVLCAGRVIKAPGASRAVHFGELGLDGRVHPVRGILPAVFGALQSGFCHVVVPMANADEAALVEGVQVSAVSDLLDVAAIYGVEVDESRRPPQGRQPTAPSADVPAPAADLRDVLAQQEARTALEVAAAGGHHLLMVGPPGTGKTMLATRLPGLLPDLEDDEAIEVTAVHSLAGTFRAAGGLIRRPPFEDPHHTATPASVVGGGSGVLRPGAISRAHHGILFLDEAPEFSPRVLETLRQPLENGQVVIHRAQGLVRYPARFQLVLAANPCPCGRADGKGLTCRCTPLMRRRYEARFSGPLMDRVDIQAVVDAPSRADLAVAGEPESTHVVAARVREARERARHRLAGTGWTRYRDTPGSWIQEQSVAVDRHLTRDLERAVDRKQLTMRGMHRVLRLAWTVAALDGRTTPTGDDIGTGLALRSRDRHV